MKEDDVVAIVLDRLETLGIPYMVVGSYASNTYGRPRSSFDADVVVQVAPADAGRLAEAFQRDFVVDEEVIAQDIAAGTMFNLIPLTGFFKVDLIPLRASEFARTEFRRRRQVQALGRSVWMASPEDTILFKLAWFKRGGEVSARQVEDASGVYRVQKGTLDESYLDRWARELGVGDELEMVRRQASE